MALWEVHCGETIIQVDAANWLEAIARSLKTFGIAQDAMKHFVCELHVGGVAQVKDTTTGIIVWARSSPSANTADSEATALEDALAASAEVPPLVLPVPMLLPVLTRSKVDFDDLTDAGRYVPPRKLRDQLAVARRRITSARSRQTACEAAVDALTEFVPAESSAVLLIEEGTNVLTFVVAHGPHAEGVLGLEVPLGHGIAGYVAGTGNSLIVLDAQTNPKHYDEVDRSTGYRTQDMLAVAIKSSEGAVMGVIELLNPPKTFVPWNLEAACSVADTLAERLAGERLGQKGS